MISVMKFTVLVIVLVGLSVNLAQCQSWAGYFADADDNNGPEAYDQANQFGGAYDPRLQSALYGPRDVADQQTGRSSQEILTDLTPEEFLSGPEQRAAGREQVRESYPDDISTLIGQLSQQKRQQSRGYYFYDVNSHLPSGSAPSEDSISTPVNDPEEFEAELGQLTDKLNHNMANTELRQRLLLGLLNRTGEHDDDLQGPINSLSSINQLDVNRFVDSLGKLLDEHANAQRTAQEDQRSESDTNTGPDSLARYGGSEYIDHPLALAGHQYVQGGAGEGRQLLGPEGTFENVQVVKSDSAIPSYCDPPNPCPVGYTAKDGCLENFVNSASFSREYQAQQKCSCDNEHSLFNCASATSPADSKQDASSTDETSPSPSTLELGAKLDTLARTIQNRFGDLASVQRLIGRQQREKLEPLASGNSALDINDDSNYLVRSARKLSSLDMHHKVDLD